MTVRAAQRQKAVPLSYFFFLFSFLTQHGHVLLYTLFAVLECMSVLRHEPIACFILTHCLASVDKTTKQAVVYLLPCMIVLI